MVHQNCKAHPEAFLKVMAPYRDDVVVAVECLFTWDLAGRSVCAGGHALRPRACPLHESHPWGQRQERQKRCPENRPALARGAAPAGLRLARCEAGDPRSPPAPDALPAQTRPVADACPEHQQPGPTCPRLARRLPKKPPVVASRSGSPIRRCRKASRWIGPCLGTTTTCSATGRSPASGRPSRITLTRCIGDGLSLVLAKC